MFRKLFVTIVSLGILTHLEGDEKDLFIFPIAQHQSNGPAIILGADFLEYFGFDFYAGTIACTWMENSSQLVPNPGTPNLAFSSIRVKDPKNVIVSPNIIISSDPQTLQEEPTLSIDRNNPNNISVSSADTPLSNVNKPFDQITQVTKGLLVVNSNDGGKTWKTNKKLLHNNFHPNSKKNIPRGFISSDVRLAYDSQGDLYYTYITFFTHSIFDLFNLTRKFPLISYLCLSTNNGKNFKVLHKFNPNIFGKTTAAFDFPQLAVSDTQVAWAGSLFNEGANAELFATDNPTQIFIFPKEEDGELGEPVHIKNPKGRQGGYGSIAFSPDGGLLISSSSLNGKLGSTPQDHSTIWTTFIPNGEKHIPKNRLFQVFKDVNVGFAANYPPQPTRLTWPQPKLAYVMNGLHTGRVYMTYVDNLDPVKQPNNTDIFIVHSDNDGKTWSKPFQITDNPNTQYMPHIAIDQTTGNIAVAWLDARNDPNDVLVQVFGTVIPPDFFD